MQVNAGINGSRAQRVTRGTTTVPSISYHQGRWEYGSESYQRGLTTAMTRLPSGKVGIDEGRAQTVTRIPQSNLGYLQGRRVGGSRAQRVSRVPPKFHLVYPQGRWV